MKISCDQIGKVRKFMDDFAFSRAVWDGDELEFVTKANDVIIPYMKSQSEHVVIKTYSKSKRYG